MNGNADTHPNGNDFTPPESLSFQSKTDKMYRIACTFPVLRWKNVERGAIPGIHPSGFDGRQLADFLYHGRGGVWSSGERVVIEFLLNLYDPDEYNAFNFGRMLCILDSDNLAVAMDAVAGFLNGKY